VLRPARGRDRRHEPAGHVAHHQDPPGAAGVPEPHLAGLRPGRRKLPPDGGHRGDLAGRPRGTPGRGLPPALRPGAPQGAGGGPGRPPAGAVRCRAGAVP